MGKTLHNILISTQWNDVEELFLEFYPDEDITYFKQLFWKLFNITPKNNDSGATLHFEIFDEEDFEDDNDDELYYENEFYNEVSDELWSIYLGFFVSEETTSTISNEEIICHFLFEITFGEIEEFLI